MQITILSLQNMVKLLSLLIKILQMRDNHKEKPLSGFERGK